MKTPKRALIVASSCEEGIAFACAIVTQFLWQRDGHDAEVEYILAQPGQFSEEQLNTQGNRYDAIFFLGEIFPAPRDNGRRGVALPSLGDSSVTHINSSSSSSSPGIVSAVLSYCRKSISDFHPDHILELQKDDHTKYCVRNALDEFRLHQDSQYFVTLVRQYSNPSANVVPQSLLPEWSKLTGRQWSELLRQHPRLVNRCDKENGWERLSGGDWSRLLRSRPEFSQRCPWDILSGRDWSELLQLRPEFKSRCDLVKGWDRFTGEEWGELLYRQYERFKSLCNWSSLSDIDSRIYIRLLERHPEIVNVCAYNWDLLEHNHWADLLENCPKFSEHCRKWPEFDGEDWMTLLCDQPQFAKQCNSCDGWSKLDKFAWLDLLLAQPRFTGKCPRSIWDAFESSDWERLLKCGYDAINQKCSEVGGWEKLDLSGRSRSIPPESQNQCESRHPRGNWEKLAIEDWWALEQDCLQSGRPGQMDATQEEKLWSYYSFFLRLPQERLDDFASADRMKYDTLRRNAMSKYRGMLVGNRLRPLREQLRLAARNRYPVLLLGESGTGKENAARMLHSWSERLGQFVPFNCASSSSGLIESTLFGHTKGAYTGADKKVDGIIWKANNGTLFFDEIAEFPLEIQAKLLRVMQWRSSGEKDALGRLINLEKMVYAYRPVGGEDEPEKEVDVRIVAATNKDLEQMIAENKSGEPRFRQDLYYRLNSIVIETLPLRKHLEDIEEIANLFWRVDLHMPHPLKTDDIKFLMSLDYPANVRQLQQLLIQYSIYNGRKSLQEIHETLSRFSRVSPDEKSAPVTPQSDTLSLMDDRGNYKTAEAIDKEYAKLIHQKLGKSLADTAHALDLAINTLRNRLK